MRGLIPYHATGYGAIPSLNGSFYRTKSDTLLPQISLRLRHHGDDAPCLPCGCKDGINDNVARRFWNCKNSFPAEGPKCKLFMWKDNELDEVYYKDQLR
ncbi:unnamed protein product [Lactuca saligna]|uniref:Zinc finger GRF-type domain-containing protein n=1 Tax=Lactuca saligna TaxID=75948 RepID=A0AA35VTQ9_LACSI|nr:unnamed protein product [Lactuca saligna]